jgi:hypothetical protein
MDYSLIIKKLMESRLRASDVFAAIDAVYAAAIVAGPERFEPIFSGGIAALREAVTDEDDLAMISDLLEIYWK